MLTTPSFTEMRLMVLELLAGQAAVQRSLERLAKKPNSKKLEELLALNNQYSRTIRAVTLFRAFLRGKPYKKVEEKTRPTCLQPENVVLAYLPLAMDLHTLNSFKKWLKKV